MSAEPTRDFAGDSMRRALREMRERRTALLPAVEELRLLERGIAEMERAVARYDQPARRGGRRPSAETLTNVQRVLEALGAHGDGRELKALMRDAGIPDHVLRPLMSRLAQRGEVRRVEQGVYALPDARD